MKSKKRNKLYAISFSKMVQTTTLYTGLEVHKRGGVGDFGSNFGIRCGDFVLLVRLMPLVRLVAETKSKTRSC